MANKILRKGLLAALGLASITKEKAGEIAEELIKRGEVSEKDVSEIAGALFEKAKTGKKAIETGMVKIVEKIMLKMNVPTKKDIDGLKKIISDLESKIKNMKK